MTIPASLQAHYDTGHTCMAVALLMQRQDGATYGFTSSSRPLVLDITPWHGGPWNLSGLTAFEFTSSQGLTFGTLESSAGFEVDETSITTLNDGSLFTEADIMAGRWNGARFRLFLYRWDVDPATITNDIETLKVGTLGQPQFDSTTVKVELRCPKQQLQQSIGIVSQPTCRVRVFSQGHGMCNKNPSGFVFTFTVTSVTDAKTFFAEDADQDPDHFGAGYIKWLDGDNAGLEMQIATFEAGVFTLMKNPVFAIQDGDSFEAITGCRGRFIEDCKNKFDNVVNFQGEPHRPTQDRIASGVG